jgi:hypothetical protein
MSRAASARKDPRYLGITSLTTAAVVSFVEFIDESLVLRLVFAVLLAGAFAGINLATMVAVLPLSRVSPDDAERSRTPLLALSVALVVVATVVALAR